MAAAESVRVMVRYDGKCLVPQEPLDLPQGEDIEIIVPALPRTWAEKHLGLPPLVLQGEGPTLSEIIIEDRGPA